jgi:RNA binding exosome subunit
MHRKVFALHTLTSAALILLVAVFVVAFLAGCSSKPVQVSETFIKGFLGKHITMVDTEITDYYISRERDGVLKQVNDSIASKKAQGVLDAIQSAELNLSNIKVEVLEKKEAYVDDENHTYVKVKVTGSYTIKNGEGSKEVNENETFILRAVGDAWKVTETENPWS